MPPLFFIVWGTVRRLAPLGARAAFCPFCLNVAKRNVVAVKEASHVYYIHGPLREVGRFEECLICGAQQQISPSAPLVPGRDARNEPLSRLVTETEPALADMGVWGQIAGGATGDVARQTNHAVHNFLQLQALEFAPAESRNGGWLGLILILLVVAVACAFALVGPYVGGTATVAAVWLLFDLRRRLVDRSVRREVGPRLRRFLAAHAVEFDDLIARLDAEDPKLPRLRRHFRRTNYEAFTAGHGHDPTGECIPLREIQRRTGRSQEDASEAAEPVLA